MFQSVSLSAPDNQSNIVRFPQKKLYIQRVRKWVKSRVDTILKMFSQDSHASQEMNQTAEVVRFPKQSRQEQQIKETTTKISYGKQHLVIGRTGIHDIHSLFEDVNQEQGIIAVGGGSIPVARHDFLHPGNYTNNNNALQDLKRELGSVLEYIIAHPKVLGTSKSTERPTELDSFQKHILLQSLHYGLLSKEQIVDVLYELISTPFSYKQFSARYEERNIHGAIQRLQEILNS